MKSILRNVQINFAPSMIVLAGSDYDQIVNQISSFYSYVQQAAEAELKIRKFQFTTVDEIDESCTKVELNARFHVASNSRSIEE